jgi:hypothetical protein
MNNIKMEFVEIRLGGDAGFIWLRIGTVGALL